MKRLLRQLGLFHPVRHLARGVSPSVRRHQQRQLEFHRGFIAPGSLCFDIGAHYGNKASIFLALGARVVAVEPTPACLEGLRWAFGSNTRVTIVPEAVSDSIGTATIYVGDSLAVSSLRSDWHSYDRAKVGVEVSTTTLDALIARYGRPDFCKIDVEGCELAVFRGLSQRIPLIAFEFMRHELDRNRACLAELARHGDFVCNVTPMEEMRLLFPEWVDSKTLIDRLDAATDLPDGDVFVRYV